MKLVRCCPCLVLVAVFCLLTVASSASAEGAWTLWMMGASSPWDSVGNFPTREQCMEALHQQAQAVEKLGLKVTEDVPGGSFAATDADRDIVGSASPTPKTRVGRRGSDMAEAAEHGGRTIEPQSYQSDGEQWRPKAIVVTHEGGSVQTLPIVAHVDITFATEAEANAYAVEMAKKWIDERG